MQKDYKKLSKIERKEASRKEFLKKRYCLFLSRAGYS